MHLYTVAESAAANSLGRAISMTLVAAELGTVETWALDDGPTWTGARHFDLDLHRFRPRHIDVLVDAVRARSAIEPVAVWISKGLAPLDDIARAVRELPVTVIADFDDDDVSLMQEQMQSSLKTALHLNFTHRKAPTRVRLAQRRTAVAAD